MSGLIWTFDEKVAFLAWLDVCRETERNFDQTVIDHMNSIGKHTFTKTEIDSHVKTLLQTQNADVDADYGAQPLTARKMLKTGSSCLMTLKSDMVKEIARCVEDYGKISTDGDEEKLSLGSGTSSKPRTRRDAENMQVQSGALNLKRHRSVNDQNKLKSMFNVRFGSAHSSRAGLLKRVDRPTNQEAP
jgi:hypothetical protein